jgi:predicted nucleic acid-binding protein
MMVISNSSSLIHLSAINRLEVLQQLFTEVIVPDEVYEEVVQRGASQPGDIEVKSAKWIKRRTIENRLASSILQTSLGAGESACIVLASEIGGDLIILLDDRLARLQAQTQSLRVTGTIGVLLMADEQGIVNFQQSLDALLSTGFLLSSTEYDRVIQLWKSKRV